MIQIPLTQGYVAIVDDEDAHLAQHRWHAKVSKADVVYAKRHFHLGVGKPQQTFYLHREVMGLESGDKAVVDHLNGDGLDCRRANLKVVTHPQNMRNLAGPPAGNTSGILGVSLEAGRWRASITVHGRKMNIGRYPTAEQANLARLTREQEVWGIQPRRRAAFEAAGLAATQPQSNGE